MGWHRCLPNTWDISACGIFIRTMASHLLSFASSTSVVDGDRLNWFRHVDMCIPFLCEQLFVLKIIGRVGDVRLFNSVALLLNFVQVFCEPLDSSSYSIFCSQAVAYPITAGTMHVGTMCFCFRRNLFGIVLHIQLLIFKILHWLFHFLFFHENDKVSSQFDVLCEEIEINLCIRCHQAEFGKLGYISCCFLGVHGFEIPRKVRESMHSVGAF